MLRIYDMSSGQMMRVGDEAAAALGEPERVCHPRELPQLQPMPVTRRRPGLTPDLATVDCEYFVRFMRRR